MWYEWSKKQEQGFSMIFCNRTILKCLPFMTFFFLPFIWWIIPNTYSFCQDWMLEIEANFKNWRTMSLLKSYHRYFLLDILDLLLFGILHRIILSILLKKMCVYLWVCLCVWVLYKVLIHLLFLCYTEFSSYSRTL